MAEHLKLKNLVRERPQSAWGTMAVELLGAQTRIVQGEKYHHRIVEKGRGNGPPLFMYHGIGGHIETYARTLPALAKNYHTIAADALYHGFTSKEPWDNAGRTTRQAEAYIDLLHALGYEKAHFEGESMGAFMGFELAMQFPETLDKLILNGMGILETKRTEFKKQPVKGDLFALSRKAVEDPSYENIRRRLLWLVHDDSTINDEMIAIRQRLYQQPEISASMRRVFGMAGDPPWRTLRKPYTEEEVKARWKTDTLVLYGEFNPLHGPDYGEYCADLIGAKFYEVKGTGHWPQWEKPDEYVEVVRSYLG